MAVREAPVLSDLAQELLRQIQALEIGQVFVVPFELGEPRWERQEQVVDHSNAAAELRALGVPVYAVDCGDEVVYAFREEKADV